MRSRYLPLVTIIVTLLGAGCGSTTTSGVPAVPTAALTAAPTVPVSAGPTAVVTATPSARPTPTGTSSPTATAPPTIGLPADDGARIIAVETLAMLQHTVWVLPGAPGCPAGSDPGCTVDVGSPIPTTRIRDLTIDSPVLGTTKVRLLLPKHFDEQPSARWPALYLYRGSGGDYTRWTELQDVATLTGPTDLLVVMPEGDNDGTTTWDTYHLVELRQLLERNWQAGDRRAVAGMSAGGYEAMHEGATSPGTFRFAGSYSGNLDTTITGYSIANEANLRGTALYVAYGNGELGPFDQGQPSSYDEDGSGERWCAAKSAAFVERLAALKIPVTVYDYGNGTHNAPYWQRDFERSFPLILNALSE